MRIAPRQRQIALTDPLVKLQRFLLEPGPLLVSLNWVESRPLIQRETHLEHVHSLQTDQWIAVQENR